MRILVLEDDKKTASFIRKGLMEAGHVAEVVPNGHDALFLATKDAFDLLVADRMVSGLDGLSTVKAIRAAGAKLPVIFLSAIGGVDDRIKGLEAGADDYLVKPFAFSELLARVNALSRRPPFQNELQVLRVLDLELDLIRRRVTRAGKPIDLKPREFALLEVLMRNKGRVITRTMLLERGVGAAFRSAHHCCRDPYQPVAHEDRQAIRPAPAAHSPQHWLQLACAGLAFFATRRSGWRSPSPRCSSSRFW